MSATRPPDPLRRPPPPLEMLPGNQVQVVPVSPGTYFTQLPANWTVAGYAGELSSATLRAPAGNSAALVLRRSQPARLARLRFGLQRDRPVNLQLGLYRGRELLVGIICIYDGGQFVTSLQGGGRASSTFNRPWDAPGVEELELAYNFTSGWTLLEVASGRSLLLPVKDSEIDGLQLIIPGAQQEQVLRFPTFTLVDQ